jgi:hypothetical protein
MYLALSIDLSQQNYYEAPRSIINQTNRILIWLAFSIDLSQRKYYKFPKVNSNRIIKP